MSLQAQQFEPDERAIPTAESGLSLVELMIAMVTMVVLLGAVVAMTVRHSSQRRLNAERNLATLAVMNTFEEVRSVAFEDLATLDGTQFDVPDANGAPGGLRPSGGGLDVLPGQLAVRPHFSFGGTTIYRVTATVQWTGVQRRNEISFEQLIAERK